MQNKTNKIDKAKQNKKQTNKQTNKNKHIIRWGCAKRSNQKTKSKDQIKKSNQKIKSKNTNQKKTNQKIKSKNQIK